MIFVVDICGRAKTSKVDICEKQKQNFTCEFVIFILEAFLVPILETMDLIKTIEDTDEINYDSGSSEDEIDEDLKAPKSKKEKALAKKKVSCKDFDESYTPVFNQKEYMKDTWSDISAYIRKKAKTSLNDKIAQVRNRRIKEEDSENDDDMDVDSENESDEEDWDDVKAKKLQKKKKKKNKSNENEEISEKGMVKIEKEENEEFFDYDESATFQSMNLSRPLLKAIDAVNWGHPTPIQAATIPTALSGRDICGCAATGTGKTAAYMLPVLERLLFRSAAESVTRVLVMVPTRELGVQVFQVCKQLARFTTIDVALSVGGLDLRLQVKYSLNLFHKILLDTDTYKSSKPEVS